MTLLRSTVPGWRVRAALGDAAYERLLETWQAHEAVWSHETEPLLINYGVRGMYPFTISLALAWAEQRASEELNP